jgi:uncharacterized SAM-binding protein YcdF (DUF218 family)
VLQPARLADAVVVLGCRSPAALKRRVDLGIRRFQEGAAPLLVLSGGGRGPVPEAERMRRAALASGIPATALLIEGRSRNTSENAAETARLLNARGLRSVLLVSDRAHLPRAAIYFRFAGLQVVGRAGVSPSSIKLQAASIARESAAVPWNVFRAVLRVGLRWLRLPGRKPRQHTPEQNGYRQGGAAGEQE